MTFRAVVGDNKFFALDADRPLPITESSGGTKIRDGAKVTFTDTKVVELFDADVGVWFQPPGVSSSSDGGDVGAVVNQEAEYDSTGLPVFPYKYAQTLSYTAGLVQTKSFTDGTDTWTKTYSYTGSDVTGISLWVKS